MWVFLEAEIDDGEEWHGGPRHNVYQPDLESCEEFAIVKQTYLYTTMLQRCVKQSDINPAGNALNRVEKADADAGRSTGKIDQADLQTGKIVAGTIEQVDLQRRSVAVNRNQTQVQPGCIVIAAVGQVELEPGNVNLLRHQLSLGRPDTDLQGRGVKSRQAETTAEN